MTGDEASMAQQQQLLQSIHGMVGELEAEKRSFLGLLDGNQVCCSLSNHHTSCLWTGQTCMRPDIDGQAKMMHPLFQTGLNSQDSY